MKAVRVLFLACAVAATTVGPVLAAPLFSVSPSGGPVSITLCLDGKAALSCQSVTVPAQRLSIATIVPNHTYAAAGIKVHTAGYALGHPGTECALASNGYCLFVVSATKPANITLVPLRKPSP